VRAAGMRPRRRAAEDEQMPTHCAADTPGVSMGQIQAAARRLPIASLSIARRSGGTNGDQA